MSDTVLLGYEIPTGKPVSIPTNAHLCVTGQTQQSGKTTTLEALIARSGKRAVTFVTKRGESSFSDTHQVAPYFRHHGDWQFVRSILEASQHSKMKFELPWLMRACRDAKNLDEVSRNLDHAQASAKRSFDQDQYMVLKAYLDVVLPQIQKITFATTLRLRDGINVMDLSAYSVELQALVIRSALEWVHDFEKGVIVVIPEAWEFLPQGRGSPVKRACEEIFRKGAALGNYVWLDSQDIAGVWKDALRACTVWILGVQREAHEVKRSLEALPVNPKPKPAQIMHLERGQFYVAYGKELKLVYVCPAWMPSDTALSVAKGNPAPEAVYHNKPKEDIMDQQLRDANLKLERENAELREVIESLKARLDNMHNVTGSGTGYSASDPTPKLRVGTERPSEPATIPRVPSNGPIEGRDFDDIWDYVRLRILADSAVLAAVKRSKPAIEVKVTRQVVEMKEDSLTGRMAILITEGFFDTPKGNQDVVKELARRGKTTMAPRVSEAFTKMAEMGFLTKEDDGYLVVKDMLVNIVEAA